MGGDRIPEVALRGTHRLLVQGPQGVGCPETRTEGVLSLLKEDNREESGVLKTRIRKNEMKT
jgi:hypothetical protein